MNNTLIIHHLESMWGPALKRFGTSFEEMLEKTALFLNKNTYNQVILTRFEDDTLEGLHYDYGLSDFITKVESYSYGWEEDSQPAEDFTDGGRHSEKVYLPKWMRDLKNTDICGAFDGECLDDLETALTALNIPYNRIEELIV